MTPAELKDMLAEFGIRPIRDRGQHFLLDERVTDAMVAASGTGAGERVVEIGPGPGILTKALLDRGADVTAVELDGKLCALLREHFPSPTFHLVQGDIMSFSNAELLSRFPSPSSKLQAPSSYKVVANLPYNITSAVLEKFLLDDPKPRSITVMVQREVADRILAGPGEMSSLAVLVQTLARPSRVVNVPASSFFPSPKVSSTVIHMDVMSQPELSQFFGAVDPAKYFSIVRKAFSGKRKQLKNTLKDAASDPGILEKAFTKAKINPQSRPEELVPEQWRALVLSLAE